MRELARLDETGVVALILLVTLLPRLAVRFEQILAFGGQDHDTLRSVVDHDGPGFDEALIHQRADVPV